VSLVDLSDGRPLEGETVQISLQPYQLRSFRAQSDLGPGDLTIAKYDVPLSRNDETEAAIALLQTKAPPGPAIAEELRRELSRLNHVRCKHILEEVRTLDLLEATQAKKE